MGSSEVNLIYFSVYSENRKSSSFKMPAFFMWVHESTDRHMQGVRALAGEGKKQSILSYSVTVFSQGLALVPLVSGSSLQGIH